jgi:hypothetical protein
MAQDEVILKLQAEVGNVTKQLEEVKKGVEGIKKTTVGAEKGIQGMAKGIKGVGLALKAAGIGILIKGLQMLGDAFMKNQKVTNLFNTVFTTLSRTLNDFVNFLVGNTGTVINIFKDIFENPQENLKALGNAIKDNIIERFNSAIETIGFLSEAFKKVFEGDFTGAIESVKEAGTEFVDVLTGVDNSAEKITEGVVKVANATKEYAVNTYNAAQAQVELNNQAEISRAKITGLVEENDRLAETQRQIRDNENATFEERIAANDKLKEILEKQKEDMLALADVNIAAAQAELDNLDSTENKVRLQEAINEKKGIEAQITGFMSEQMTNAVALENERLEAVNTVNAEMMSARQREIEDVRLHYEEQIKIAKKAGQDITGLEKKRAEAISEVRRQQRDADLNNANTALSNMKGLFNEESAAAKGIAIAQATIETYKAAAAALSPPPTGAGPLLGPILAGTTIASGLAQVGKIVGINTQFNQGGMVGGFGSGKSDSIPARLSKGESVINAKSTRMFKPLLSDINKAGGGVGFADGGTLDTGSAGMTTGIVKAFVVADEMTNEQDRLNNIRRKATI